MDFKLKWKGLNQTQSAAVIFLSGVLAGVVFANLFRKYYIHDLRVLNYTYQSILSNQPLDYLGLLKYSLLNNLKEFFAFWILCLTILGIPYVVVAIVYKGIQVGFLISSVTILYHTKGILLFFAYIMPQALIYIPVMLISLQKGYQLAQASSVRNQHHTKPSRTMVLGYLALILLLLALLGIGSLVETYLGSALLKKTLQLCT